MNERISPTEVERRIEGIVELELEAWNRSRARAEADTASVARGPSELLPAAKAELARASR